MNDDSKIPGTNARVEQLAAKAKAGAQRHKANGAIHPANGEEQLSLEEFWAFMPKHQYIHVPTLTMWPAPSVNARVPWQGTTKPTVILDKNRAVEQMSWMPGRPQIVEGFAAVEAGIIPMPGVRIFNTYRAPPAVKGDPNDVEPFLLHLLAMYPSDADQILNWFAHRSQLPAEKLNHALVLGGAIGIGKDTLLAPLLEAVGTWNCSEVSPKTLLGSEFNEYLKSVVLRISEARDLGDFDRYAFYDHTKPLLAAPPDVLRVNEKNIPASYVPNVMGVVITTNHLETGMFLPRDDRRHYVAWSNLPENDAASAKRCADLWAWYENGGMANVISMLRTRDLASFKPKSPPLKTAAFFAIAQANTSHDESELADLLDGFTDPPDPANWPRAVTLRQLADAATMRHMDALATALMSRTHSRLSAGRLANAGYMAVSNPQAKDGLWKIAHRRQVVYARKNLSVAEQFDAVRGIAGGQ